VATGRVAIGLVATSLVKRVIGRSVPRPNNARRAELGWNDKKTPVGFYSTGVSCWLSVRTL